MPKAVEDHHKKIEKMSK
jgi:hypothetical protein